MKKIGCILLVLLFILSAVNAQNREFKISSYNVRNDNKGDSLAGNGWSLRCPVIADMTLFYGFDIMGTQECKYNQILDLDKALSNYNYIGRGRGANPTEDEFSAIFYNSEKFRLINNGDFWFSETPQIPSKGWDAAINRICSWGEFEEKNTEFHFYVFNLHLDHIGVEARKNSILLLLSEIKNIAGDQPVIVMGDFNVDQSSEPYKIMENSDFLTDCYANASVKYFPNGTFNNFDMGNINEERIDHIFITDHFKPEKYGILPDIYWDKIPKLPSDHYPVVATLRY